MSQPPESFDECLIRLVAKASGFMPAARHEQTARRWITPAVAAAHPDVESHAAIAELAADLAEDFMLSSPSASGGTAFDRMARGFCGTAQEVAALEALRTSRFRVLRFERLLAGKIMQCTDLVSQDSAHVHGAAAQAMDPGLVFFCRAAQDRGGLLYLAGIVTPLDEAALAVATGPACPPRFSREKEARWVETVYMHVVRHGTLRVPGINAPEPLAVLKDIPDDLAAVVSAFLGLNGAAPDEALIADTRRLIRTDTILSSISGVMRCRASGETELARAFERVALLLLETLNNRETMIGRTGSGFLNHDHVNLIIAQAVRDHGAPAALLEVFRELSRRAASAAAAPDNADMQRLVARIRALRAKTIDQGCTEHEALAAAEKVAELLDRHGLSLSELEVAQQPCSGLSVATERKRFAPADHCAPAVAAFFDCRHWTEQPPGGTIGHVFFGLRADVAAAEFLFSMVERVFADEVSRFHLSDIYLELRGDRHAATKSFQEGLAHGIRTKLTALRAARASHMVGSTGRDLVPAKSAAVEAALDKLGMNLSLRTRGGAARTLSEPFAAGAAAAERFEYLPGIAGTG